MRTLKIVLAAAWLAASSLAAQSWRGSTALEIEIGERGKKGKAEAEVTALYVEIEPKAGPPAVSTDATGKARLSGLAEGRWLIEVRIGGAKAYSAVLRIIAGKKPEIVAGPVRDAAAPMVEVKLGKAVASVEIPPAAPAPKPEPTVKPATPPTPTAPPVTTAPRPVPTAPAASPPATAPPVAAPPAPKPAVAEPRPEPAPSKPTPAPPPTPTPPAPSVAPAPPATPATPATPPAPVVASPAPPPSPVRLRSVTDGSCPECKPGEWALTLQLTAGPASETDPPCNAAADMAKIVAKIAAAAEPALARYVGPLIDPASGALAAAAGARARAEAQPLLEPYLRPESACHLLAATLPAGTKYRGYAYEVLEGERTGACAGAEPCELGGARWQDHPTVLRTDFGTVVFGVFKNQAPRERRARLVIYLAALDPAWQPPR